MQQNEDLSDWVPVLEQLEDLLLSYQCKIQTNSDFTITTINDEEFNNAKFDVCVLLKFLIVLVRSSDKKHYFMLSDVIIYNL